MLWINDIPIFDSAAAREYLSSLGLNKFEIQEFSEILAGKHDENAIYWEQEAKEWELESSREFEKLNSLICEIQELADELESGKGGTKKQYAEKFRQACEFWY